MSPIANWGKSVAIAAGATIGIMSAALALATLAEHNGFAVLVIVAVVVFVAFLLVSRT